jgi:hypothetical protein
MPVALVSTRRRGYIGLRRGARRRRYRCPVRQARGDEPTTAVRQHRGGDDATRPPTPLNAIATDDAAPETRLVIGEKRGYSQSEGSSAMGTSDQPSRTKLLAWLAGFVVVFGAVSWLVSTHSGHPNGAIISRLTPSS